MPDHHIAPFVPPPRDPLQAHLDNMLLTRQHPWTFLLWDHPLLLCPDPSHLDFSPVAHTCIHVGDQNWYLELDSLDCVSCHPALADLPARISLPQEVQLALLDLACSSVQTMLAQLMKTQVKFSETALGPAPLSSKVSTLSLNLSSADSSPIISPMSVRIHVPSRHSALFLADRLAALPLGSKNSLPHDLFTKICLDAGSMILTLSELTDLRPGDVLLPQDYPAAQGRIILRLYSGPSKVTNTSRYQDIMCTIQGNQATIVTITRTAKESAMTTDPSAPQPENSPTNIDAPSATTETEITKTEAIDTGAIEVELCFELDRQQMSIADIVALVPGYTFTLGCDPLAPVALRVHGLVVGTGRLVDINGILGVQITTLTQPEGQNAGL